VRIGILLGNLLHQQIHFPLSLLAADSRFEPSEHVEPIIVTLAEIVAAINQGNPNVGSQPDHASSKTRRRYADDRTQDPADMNGLTDDEAVSPETALPKRIADHNGGRSSRRFLFHRPEEATEQRLET
jgi:hypothetical protein